MRQTTGNVNQTFASGQSNAVNVNGNINYSVLMGFENARLGALTVRTCNQAIIIGPYRALYNSTGTLNLAIALGDQAGINTTYNTPALFGKDAQPGANLQVVLGSSYYTGGVVVDGKNFGINYKSTFNAAGDKVMVHAEGTAPDDNIADAFQVWVADRGGTGGKAGWHWRAEDGTLFCWSDYSGIGTQTPTFTKAGGAWSSRLMVEGATDSASHEDITMRRQHDTYFPRSSYLRARAGGTAVADDDYLGICLFRGHDGTDFNDAAGFAARIDGAVAANTVPTELIFYTTETNAATERMKIAPDGTVILINSIEVGAAQAYYLGDKATNGSWRIIRDGDDLSFERREAGAWVSKGVMSA